MPPLLLHDRFTEFCEKSHSLLPTHSVGHDRFPGTRLRPGETAEFVINNANGIPESGVYSIVAGTQVVDLARVDSTGYVNPFSNRTSS
jgi:hypothetical protein